MLRWLDFKNIFIWFGFSHIFAMLCFFCFFLLWDGRLLEGACARHVALHVPYACAHWSFQNSGRYKCTPRGMVVEVWFVPPGHSAEEKKEKKTKKKSKGKSSHWLLGKNSKRHNFIGSKWNHALQKVICSFKYKYNLWGRAFDSSFYPEFLDG